MFVLEAYMHGCSPRFVPFIIPNYRPHNSPLFLLRSAEGRFPPITIGGAAALQHRPSTRLIGDVYNEWVEWVGRVEGTKVLRMGGSHFSIWVGFWGEKWLQSWKRAKKGQKHAMAFFAIGPKPPFLGIGGRIRFGEIWCTPHQRAPSRPPPTWQRLPLPLFLYPFWSLKGEKHDRFAHFSQRFAIFLSQVLCAMGPTIVKYARL